jgi:hypothetical protein
MGRSGSETGKARFRKGACAALGVALTVATAAQASEAPKAPPRKTASVNAAAAEVKTNALQTRRARNVISLEVLGRGIYYSLNYDRMIHPYFAVGAGFSFLGLNGRGGPERSMINIPLYSNVYLSKASARMFLTGGVNLVHISGEVDRSSGLANMNVAPVFGAGYEFRHENGFVFRLTPYVAMAPQTTLWVGASLGGSF